MFRISQVIQKVVSGFHDAALAIEDGASKLYDLLPASMKQMVDRDVAIAKQYVSDAITMADASIAQHQHAIALAVEQGIDTELSLLTQGKSVAFNALTNSTIDQLVAAAVAAAHNAGLSIKARLAASSATAQAQAGGVVALSGGGGAGGGASTSAVAPPTT